MKKENKLRVQEKKKVDNPDVMSGKIGEFNITLVKSPYAPEKGVFLVARVSVGSRVLWNFKDEKFKGFAILADLNGAPSICLVSKRDKEVKKVIPIKSLLQKEEDRIEQKGLLGAAKEKIKLLSL